MNPDPIEVCSMILWMTLKNVVFFKFDFIDQITIYYDKTKTKSLKN